MLLQFQGGRRWPSRMMWLGPILPRKKTNIPTLGPRLLVRFLRVGKAIEVNTILYYQVWHITYNLLLYLSLFKPIHQLVKKVKIVEVGPRDGLQNEKVCETVWLCKNKKEGPLVRLKNPWTAYLKRSFFVEWSSGMWNSLPIELKQATSLN